MKISVTVGCYNQEKYIEECILSILEQNVDADLEILIGDDNSTDGTVEIIKRYEALHPNIIFPIYREKNVGGNENYCDLIMKCTGDYIAHLDGDDLMLAGKLQKQLDFLEKNQDFIAVTHNMKVTGSDENYKTWLFNTTPQKARLTIKDIVENGAGLCQSSKMYRRSCVPQNEELVIPTKVVGDWLFHIMNARFGDFGYINEVLGEYRRTPISLVTVHAKNIDLILDDLVLTLKIAETYTEVESPSIKKGLARVFYERAARHLEIGNNSRFKECIQLSYSYEKINYKQRSLYMFSGSKFLLKALSFLHWTFKNKRA